MTDATAPAISSESRPRATLAIAARVGRVAVRLLLVVLMLLPLYGLLKAGVRPAGPLAMLGLFAITLLRPEDGLLLVAAFVPIGGPPAMLLQCGSLLDISILTFLAAWVLRETVRPAPPVDAATRAILLPAWLFGAVTAASMLTQIVAYQVFEDFPWPYIVRVFRQLTGEYVLGRAFPSFAAGALILEGLGLFTAVVVLCRRHPELTRRAIAMIAVGGIAVAALNVNRLAEISLRTPGALAGLMLHPRATRISAVFPDPNAAASYLCMMLLVIAGLVAAPRRSAWPWAVGGLAVLTALWVTGSRTALPAGIVAGSFVFLWKRRHRRVWFWCGVLAMAAALASLVLLDWKVTGSSSRFNLRAAVLDRSEYSLAAIRAFRDGPIFGVGVGRFWSVSEGYIADPALRAFAPHENAHNNFLQILAELGCAGIVPFIWLLAAVLRRALRARGEIVLDGLIGGVLAFLLTCLVGHPLLIAPVALGFWLVFGATAARCPHPGEVAVGRQRRWPILVLAGAAVCLALSIPIRASWASHHDGDLSQVAIGFSGWHVDQQGVRYRTMTGRGEFYVPGSACGVRVGVRIDPTATVKVADVDLALDGQMANRVRVKAESWTDLRVALRPDARVGFRRVGLRTGERDVIVMTSAPTIVNCSAF